MADKRIKGITIELNGDTTKLGKALQGVEKNTRDITGELSQVEKLLKLSPKSTELLAQKQKLLADAVTNSKEKLETLKTAQDQAVKALERGEIGEDQYRAIQREVIKAEQELKSLEKQLGEVNNKWQQAADKMGAFGDKLTGAGQKMLPVTAGIVGAGGLAFKMAADVQDAMGATDQVFKESADGVKDWADSLESYYGIAEGEALEYSNMMGSMLQNIGGLTEEEAAKQSQTLIALAGDLTAMYGGTTADAVQALTGALKGNNTMLDNYGMAANDAMIKSKALEMGLISEGKTMELATKQAATLALIMEQSGAAQGQAAREADGASGSMRALVTEGKNLTTSFGEALLPVLTPLVASLKDLIGRFTDLSPETRKIIVIILGLVAAIGPLLIVIGSIASGIAALMPVITGLGTVFAVLTGPIGLVIAAIAAVIAIGVLLYKNWDKIIAFAANLKDQLSAKFAQIKETIVTKISDAMAFIRELPAKALQWGKDIVNGLWNGIKSLAGTLKSNVSKFISDNVPGVVKKLLGINSPSKLFEGMGVNVVEGFSKGIEGTTKNLRNAASSMASAATVGASSSTVRHTFDPLTVRGVNNQGELVAVVERTMKDILYWEGR